MKETLKRPVQILRDELQALGSVLVAFSGGVDSSFLLKFSSEVLGDKVLAVTAVSATYTAEEHERARKLANEWDVRHISIKTDELADPDFAVNPNNRCYYCKRELFSKLREIADKEGLAFVVDATNADDKLDYRPGRKAALELGVRSPLLDAGITKENIRELSKEMGLSTWNLPAAACLASRFPYGEKITLEKLARAEKAEKFLKTLMPCQLRVRSHGNIARIEVPADQIKELADSKTRARVAEKLRELGFTYITLDLEGYRMGSLNEEIDRSDLLND